MSNASTQGTTMMTYVPRTSHLIYTKVMQENWLSSEGSNHSSNYNFTNYNLGRVLAEEYGLTDKRIGIKEEERKRINGELKQNKMMDGPSKQERKRNRLNLSQ